jgi:hypothetical protein
MLSILGIVVIVVACIHTYRSARDTGRRAGLWLLAVLVVGIGLQFVVPIVLGIIIAIFYLATGSTQAQLAGDLGSWSMVIGIGCLVLSVVGMLYIAKRAAVVPDEPAAQPPPPPPIFGDQT